MGRKAGGGLVVGRILLRHLSWAKGIAPKAKNDEKAIPFDLMLLVVLIGHTAQKGRDRSSHISEDKQPWHQAAGLKVLRLHQL